jgi:ATP-dependent DNA helicase RecQ
LTTDLAEALGSALGIPVRDVLQRTGDRPPQSDMDNSAQQLTNVRGAFVVHGDVPPGPVLLVDDTVASRWTLTAVGALLRRAGSGPVLPFALAQARG